MYRAIRCSTLRYIKDLFVRASLSLATGFAARYRSARTHTPRAGSLGIFQLNGEGGVACDLYVKSPFFSLFLITYSKQVPWVRFLFSTSILLRLLGVFIGPNSCLQSLCSSVRDWIIFYFLAGRWRNGQASRENPVTVDNWTKELGYCLLYFK